MSLASTGTRAAETRAMALAERVFDAVIEVADRATLYLGDRLGRYRGLAGLGEATPGELAATRRMVGDGGTVMIGDERVAETFTAPVDPIERLMYAASVAHCLPVGLSEKPSAATGTVMRTDTLRRYAGTASFRKAEVLPIENDVWRFYRLTA